MSSDGAAWREVYDTRTTPPRPIEPVADARFPTTRFSLEDQDAFRFVRLTYRSSKGQNRLLFRKLSVYGSQ